MTWSDGLARACLHVCVGVVWVVVGCGCVSNLSLMYVSVTHAKLSESIVCCMQNRTHFLQVCACQFLLQWIMWFLPFTLELRAVLYCSGLYVNLRHARMPCPEIIHAPFLVTCQAFANARMDFCSH
eukprot:GDKI01021579.1.p1 GENE.GDKI01021579.1~~GDKI01021579.1.p1  ORF type:complete len:126 (+),score=23.33 GDKI01021579.1:57-434(+)